MNKKEVFKTELANMKSTRIRKSAETFIEMLPDYFFTTAASSTGKYHPSFASGEGGLVRHTKVACYILNEILSTQTFGSDFSDDEKDLLLLAILIHDGFKHGVIEEKYTKHEHPLICAICLRNAKADLELTETEIEFVAAAVESHMGEWNKSNYSDIELALPITQAQKLVHLSDMLSSKKILNVDFIGNEIKRD
ncbi:MAG: HD domain-containing protein [Bacilli bacterium]|nr:HD domain-containing protein [Bacilli bacterium]